MAKYGFKAQIESSSSTVEMRPTRKNKKSFNVRWGIGKTNSYLSQAGMQLVRATVKKQ